MKMRNWFVVPSVCIVISIAALAKAEPAFHVAPDGSDDNPGTEAQPFATIEKAREAVRAVNRDMSGDVEVVLHGGTYTLDRTLLFDSDDSGANGHNVVYKARPGQTPILSGGRPVTGWQPDQGDRWKAPAPIDNFRQFYVNGVRATRAQGAVPSGLESLGDDGYTTTDVAMADWKNADDLEFCYQVVWAHTRCKVKGKDTCNEHDNFFNADPAEHQDIIEKAGLEFEYRDLLKSP